MFSKIMTSFVAVTTITMMSAMAVAGVPSVSRTVSLDKYFTDVAAKGGKSKEEVKDEAIEALRGDASIKVSEEDLERIGHEKIELDPARQAEIARSLEKNPTFRSRVGLTALRNEKVNAEASKAFEAMKNKDSTAELAKNADETTPAASNPKTTKGPKVEMARDVIILGEVSKVISPEAAGLIKNSAPQNYKLMRDYGGVLSMRVKKGTSTREEAEQMITDAANSATALNGKLIIGEGASQACMGMGADAVRNFGKFMHTGVAEGKDAVTMTEAMGKEAADEFKQKLEEGIARVCALASSGCRLFSQAIVEACEQINAAKP